MASKGKKKSVPKADEALKRDLAQLKLSKIRAWLLSLNPNTRVGTREKPVLDRYCEAKQINPASILKASKALVSFDEVATRANKHWITPRGALRILNEIPVQKKAKAKPEPKKASKKKG